MRRHVRSFQLAVDVILIILVVIYLVAGVFMDDSKARSAIESSGYTNYQITGHEWLMVSLQGCGGDDQAKFDFTATNSQGKQIQAYVCAGILKGGTIRFP